MPCLSGPTYSDDYEARRKIERLEAMLCALIRVTGLQSALEKADWKEAGVGGAELQRWWNEHQAKDRARRDREARDAEQQRKMQEALGKLTEEEQRVLGLPRIGGLQ